MDWDNTLRRGFTISDWAGYLVQHGVFDQTAHRGILDAVAAYADGELRYEELSYRAPSLYAEGLRGQDVQHVAELAEEFVISDEHNLFPFAKPLLWKLYQAGINIVVISGCPVEVLNAYSGRLPWGQVFGVTVGARGNRYRSNLITNPAGIESKRQIVDQLGYRSKVTVAFGDSNSDLPLFDASQWKVVVDNQDLFRSDITARHLDSRSSPQGVVEEVIRLLEGETITR